MFKSFTISAKFDINVYACIDNLDPLKSNWFLKLSLK